MLTDAIPERRRAIAAFAVAGILLLVLAPVTAYVNLERFLVESPRVVPSTEERITFAALLTDECRDAGPRAHAVMERPYQPLLRPTLESIPVRGREFSGRSFAEGALTATDYGDYDCIVVTRISTNPAATQGADVVRLLESDFGYRARVMVKNVPIQREAIVLTKD